jgi:hypothetical protein
VTDVAGERERKREGAGKEGGRKEAKEGEARE